MICELGTLASIEGWPPCGGAIHGHHIINKSKYRGLGHIKKYIDKHPHIFFANVCAVHNVGRWADTPAARRFLLLRKCDKYGAHNVINAIDNIPWKTKPVELSFDGLVGKERRG